ncbi:MAG: Transcriptional regulator, MarR family [Candidatus Uhrbacteria bacterium GW2011_GWF2_41_16]|jgi:DNA-binding MarR family transcriptional regulator|uniref:Transcriptional regulator, MarR family n=2 Tax=Candidatus Uhriibacteriota TaxID=1752732 RepID=A0A0G0VB30_9BACT|nr:MAG: Transcriptional regulator, MarR family [Candidatus Uhrbacteria bacterium GW2011_GWA2_41_10]KKR86735.1 MAG: Transcriptional regulator, MarR family [Candidatus Uhrbacteria bacterium GW2011_GWC2_41_11]KKR98113.1 MAG: Transcriptional regulator, MarR family [Candidatus Uhrbacteria bacterium GW2011_GWF2_41_16]HBP00339.1 MarR family transcriptional regulator [Candidatus Uhrbacteria bacterium]
MSNIQPSVAFFLELGRTQAIMARRFDSGLGGLGLTEFMILYHLSTAENERMRRIDLAEKVGLTPSGVTRLLAPMEKVGLIKREAYAEDARVSQVMLVSGGKRKLEEGMERAEVLTEDIFSAVGIKNPKALLETLRKLGKIRC